jgi:phosphoglycolate phosphatase
MLDALSEKGVKLAVLSNKSALFTRRMVREILDRWRFERVVGEGPEFPLKPDPLAALDIAASFGLPPAEIGFVGDSDIDMATAVAGGMCPIGVAWGFRTVSELRNSGARHLLDQPSDLQAVL